MTTPLMQALRKWIPVILCCVMSAFVIALFAFKLVAVRDTQLTTAPQVTAAKQASVQAKHAAAAAQAGVDILNDCLTPGGVCYERGKANQKQTIQQLVGLNIVIQLCLANDGHSYQSMYACVTTLGKAHDLIPDN